jgi:selenium metabolism protein YedF
MKTINAKGLLCPQPLIMTKKALLEMKEDETLQILLDNENSCFNVSRFLKDNGMEIQVDEKQDEIEILVVKKGQSIEKSTPEEYCEIEQPKSADYMVFVKKDKFGEGDPELGTMLMNGFFNTLPNVSKLPKAIVFVNSGINLILKDSPVLDPLKELEKAGIEILICGTCVEFYKKTEEIGVGSVSNMLDILEKMTEVSKIIYP